MTGGSSGGEKRRTQSEFDRQIWEMVLGPPLTTNPIDSKGNDLASGKWHLKSVDCWCKPNLEITQGGDLLVIHNRVVRK